MTRALWEVWKDGAVWMVQGPRARVHFNSKKTALAVAERAKALAALEAKIAATCKAHAAETEARTGGRA